MQPNLSVLPNAIIKAGGPPSICEEHHAHCLAKIVKLKSTCPYGIHDTGIVDCAVGDFECSGAEKEVCVCCRSKGVTNYQKSYIIRFGT